MTTRAVVKFQYRGETEAIIYKHCDGYPEGLGVQLLHFIEKIRRSTQSNFMDGCMAARLCVYLLNIDPHEVLSVCQSPPGDEEFIYIVECKGATVSKPPTVVCWHPDESGQVVTIEKEGAK